MTTSARRSFESCLSGVNNRLADYKGRHLFTNPRHTFWGFFQRIEGPDKLLKLADPILDTIGEIAKASGASDSTLDGIEKGRSLARVTRDGIGFFTIFNGVIPALAINLKNIYALTTGLISGKDVPLTEIPRQHNDVAIGKTEKILAAGANFGKGVGAATCIVGFGLCRPIANIEKYGGISLGQTAHNIGKAFPTVMMVGHIGGIIGSSCEIGYQYTAFNRDPAITEVQVNNNKKYNIKDNYESFVKKMVENTVGLVEKILEFIQTIVKLIGHAIPAWFRLPLTLGIASLGLYKVWLKTE